MAALAGINLPDGADQFVSGPKLLENMQTQINNERNYNFKQKELDQQKELKEQELALKGKLIDAQIEAARRKASGGGGGGRGSDKGPSTADYKWAIAQSAKFKAEHPNALFDPYGDMANAGMKGMEQKLGVAPDYDDTTPI